MPITYDLGDNRITITHEAGDTKGDSYSNPYTFEDVYTADLANGWGCITKTGNHYEVDCAIQCAGVNTYIVFNYISINITVITNNLFYMSSCHFRMTFFRLEYTLSFLTNRIYAVDNNVDYIDNSYFIGRDFRFNNVKIESSYFHGWFLYLEAGAIIKKSIANGISGGGFINPQNTNQPVSDIYFVGDTGVRIYVNPLTYLVRLSDVYLAMRPNGIYETYIIDCKVTGYEIQSPTTGLITLYHQKTLKWLIGECFITLYDNDDNVILNKQVSNNEVDYITYKKQVVEAVDSVVVADSEANYEPFRVVIKKAGYETIEIPNIYMTEDVGGGERSGTLFPMSIMADLKPTIEALVTNKGIAIKANKENYGANRDFAIIP